MTVKTYHVSKSGNTKITTNFKVKEFQCHDGTDLVLIDTELVNILQMIRDHFKAPVTITSGYRTNAYNSKIGGSKTSFHVKGRAADIKVKGVDPVLVGMYAETLRAGGIGLYSYPNGFVHIDTRITPYRWLQLTKTGSYEGISKILPVVKQGGSNNTINAVKLIQRELGISQSGSFGDITNNEVRKLQSRNGLYVDGIVGNKTWRAMFS